MTALIKFEQVSKAFGKLTVVDLLDLEIAKGEFLSLLGPSGSGKTTILMMLAGFEAPSSGAIRLQDKRINHLPAHLRNMGVVFQNYALFPHMTVAENVAFPLLMRGTPKAEIALRVGRALDMVKLTQLKDRKPSQLSGGQQQRVALTRALVFEPTVMLMDEPLGALDKQLREHMQLELRELHRHLGLTIVFVTHDQGEALTMSDRIAVFNAGKIEQLASPDEIYDRPRTRFVAEFIGETNLLSGILRGRDGDLARFELTGGASIIIMQPQAMEASGHALVSLRPERVRLSQSPAAANAIPVTVQDTVYQGDHLRVKVFGEGVELVSKVDRKSAIWPVGAAAFASFEPAECTAISQ
ncbi:polyamine-transporting ATPase [Mesorhizobium tianshanense]|uniref:Spermidine/putrescine import ATP-binding protein PotA n=1 Tax=Mesorhizobium tianshanense TaxID=39844 RepID=A0A562MV20_9HYPH|nr:ABC transporter ATP-binding protein [Mesorhizobium tianshanense]TWI23757.1 putative spermidine/putrescine transport system ATP-binding protein [Mesorhizobium tianshanense]GLS37433.1 polyamine-transporting ATPase [Mesorhizobium tianshanense]